MWPFFSQCKYSLISLIWDLPFDCHLSLNLAQSLSPLLLFLPLFSVLRAWSCALFIPTFLLRTSSLKIKSQISSYLFAFSCKIVHCHSQALPTIWQRSQNNQCTDLIIKIDFHKEQLICDGIKLIQILRHKSTFHHLQIRQLLHQMHLVIGRRLFIHAIQSLYKIHCGLLLHNVVCNWSC